MISLTILILFPVSISTSLSIHVLLLLWILLWFAKEITRRFRSHMNMMGMLLLFLFKRTKQNIRTSNFALISRKLLEKSSTESSNGNQLVLLHDDVWVEIMCRLTPKQLVQCKSVSKTWNRLIYDLCIPKITTPLYGFFFPYARISGVPGTWGFASVSNFTGLPNLSIVDFCSSIVPFTISSSFLYDTCNDLLLFFHHPSHLFYVCNPSTEQCIALPRSPEDIKPFSAALTFHNDDPQHYSVVYFRYSKEAELGLRMFIFSSMTHQWLVHKVHMEDGFAAKTCWNKRFVFLDGFLYNLSMYGHLLVFNIREKSARAVQLPEFVQTNKNPVGQIGLSKGCLHYGWSDHNMSQVLVWTLDQSQWVLKYTFSLIDITKYPIPGVYKSFLYSYAFHPTSEVILLGHVLGIFSYYPGTKKMKRIYMEGDDIFIPAGGIFRVCPFSRSLITLYDLNASNKEEPRGKVRCVGT